MEAPSVLGFDDKGREILSFIEGDSIGDGRPWPSWAWSDETLSQTGELLRRYHEAVRTFIPPQDAQWRYPSVRTTGRSVVCHNDVAPYNLVWRDGRIVGLVDWDLACPSNAVWDVAFAAWQTTPLHDPAHAESLGAESSEAPRRLRLFLDAYGLRDRVGFVDLMKERIEMSIERIQGLAAAGDPQFSQLDTGPHLEYMRGAIRHIEHTRPTIESSLRI
jgi:aminoglycoside phosphotransferase (APT) family kinase protein